MKFDFYIAALTLISLFGQDIFAQSVQPLRDECGKKKNVLVTATDGKNNVFTVRGKLLTEDYDPMSAALISCAGDTVRSDVNGKFTMKIRPDSVHDTFMARIESYRLIKAIIFRKTDFREQEYYTVFTDNIILHPSFIIYDYSGCCQSCLEERPRSLFDRIIRANSPWK